jgi:hypothetical protein
LRQRGRRGVVTWSDGEDLVDAHPPLLKRQRAAGQVHPPHPTALGAEQIDSLAYRPHVHIRGNVTLYEWATAGLPTVPRHLLHEDPPAWAQ